jgi:hypothetical protein
MEHLARYVQVLYTSFSFASCYNGINFQAASVSRICNQVMRSNLKKLKTSELKRRVGYVNDEVVVTRSRLSRMEIDDKQDKAESSSSRAVAPEDLD